MINMYDDILGTYTIVSTKFIKTEFGNPANQVVQTNATEANPLEEMSDQVFKKELSTKNLQREWGMLSRNTIVLYRAIAEFKRKSGW